MTKLFKKKRFLLIKRLFHALLFLLSLNSGAQSLRYSNIVFDKTDTLKNIEFATAPWLNNKVNLLAEYNIHEGETTTETRPLLMDIFTPEKDTVTKRPAIIFMHSGGFLLGTRHNDDMVALCDSFARRGYVTATIDYRLGMGATISRFLGIIIGAKVDNANGYRAFYRAMQDARAAVRFLKHNHENFGIDSSKIFLFGSSAGAILGIQNLYLDKNQEIDSAAYKTPSLGSPDTIGIQGFGGKANGVVALWGSIQMPELIENETTPLFLAHGTDDDVVPFRKGKLLGNIEIPIPTIKLELPEGYGSFCIDTALQNRGIPHEIYFVEGKKHEFYGVDTGEFPVDGPNACWDTIIWKTSDFLFDIFKPKAGFSVETQNLKAVFSNTSTDIYSARWNFGDNITAEGKTVEHVFAQAGNYKITLTTCNRNQACDTISKNVTVGHDVFAGIFSEQNLSIFPNPTSGIFRINGINSPAKIRIFDLQGNLKAESENSISEPISIQHFKAGLYIVEIEMENRKIKMKLVKNDRL